MSPKPATTQMLADYLTTGYWQDTHQPATHFNTSASNVISVNLSGLSTAGKTLARTALDSWEAVADIRFEETTGSAKITFTDNAAASPLTSTMSTGGGVTSSAKVNVPSEWLSKYGTSVGTYSLHTYIHEIGHALGLGHPATYAGGADYEDANFTIDSWQQSVMSYLNQDENPVVDANWVYLLTPMKADILAIQQLYGRPQGGATAGNTRHATGQLPGNAMTIFDEGGIDTIDLSNDTWSQEVNLAGGAYSSVFALRGNLGIAQGTLIENYKAGSGHDRVTGNQAANVISLGGGNDTAFGLGGFDRLSGDKGDDVLDGGTRADKLFGGDGRDRLVGGQGNDRLSGGAGADSFVFSSGRDVVLGFADDQDRLVLDADLWGGARLSTARLLDFARVSRGDILLEFAGDHVLRIQNRTDIQALADDLVII